MSLRLLAASLGIAATLTVSGPATAQGPSKPAAADPKADAGTDVPKTDVPKADAPKKGQTTERATFGGGCFWCMEAVYERIPGVKSVVSGYAGGNVPFPSYEAVHTGQTGHAEVIQVEYDPAVVSYEKLLKVFWSAHDPTTPNAQGDDFGTQYRSIILFHNEAQRKAAVKSHEDLVKARAFRHPIVTELAPLTAFFPAEDYHQDYYRNNRGSLYSQSYIDPKLKKLHLSGRPAPAKKKARPAAKPEAAPSDKE